MYQMVVTDLDGTLLNHDKKVSPKNASVLREVMKKVPVVLASNRVFSSIEAIAKENSIGDYIIAANGAFIYDRNLQQVLFEKQIEKNVCIALLQSNMRSFARINFCTINHWYTYGEGGVLRREYVIINQMEQFLKDLKEPIHKIELYYDIEEDYLLEMERLETLNLDLEIHYIARSFNSYLEIVPNNTNKWNALKYLCDQLQIDFKHIVAFGDGLNDVLLIENVGMGIAMANAHADVAKVSKYQTCSNDEDGVALWLEKNML